MYLIDDELKSFLESGVVTAVATVSAAGRPHHAPAWGPRVVEGNRAVDIFLEDPRAETPLADLDETGRMAIVFAEPVTYRSVQLKGLKVEVAPATEAERSWIESHRERCLATLALIGDPAPVLRNLWIDSSHTRVRIAVEQAFDQTPGPNAGVPL